jgi:hypothetical protein
VKLKSGLFLIALLAIVVYANVMQAGFTFDDWPHIRTNPAVTAGVDLIQIFSSPFPGDLYRPFAVLTFAVNERLAPGSTMAYHGVNVLLHTGVTVLVFLLAHRLFRSVQVAQVAGVLFALHPVHTEAVSSVAGRTELLVALFGLAAILSLDRADTAARRPMQGGLRLLSLTCFMLALFSKESALVVLPLILLFRIARRGEPLASGFLAQLRSLDWVPFSLCAGVYLFFRFHVVGGLTVNRPSALDNVLAFVPWTVRIPSALGVLWDYFGLLNVPWILSADYSYAQVPIAGSWNNPRFLAGLGLVVTAVYVTLRDRRPALTFAVLLPFVALSLTSNLLFPIGTVKAERLLYLPSVGWVLLVAVALDWLVRMPRYRMIGFGLLTVMVGAFAARTWVRNWDWRDNATLHCSTARSAPNSAKAHYNFGHELLLQGADAEAVAHFHRALDIYPYGGGEGAPLEIGIIFDKQRRMNEAIEWYEKALDLKPEFGKAHTNLCRALLIEGQFDKASIACRRGLRYDPGDANLLKGLGESFIGMGKMEEGTAVLRRALAINEQDEPLRARLADLEASTTGSGPGD